MLGKLFKHEMKAGMQIFPPMLIALAAFTILIKALYADAIFGFVTRIGGDSFLLQLVFLITSMLYGLLVACAFLMAIVVIAQRFHKNLLGDEGYLMLTLPVHPWQHILARMLSGCVWMTVNFFAGTCSMLVLLMTDISDIGLFWWDLWDFFGIAASYMGIPFPVFLLELLFLYLVVFFGGMTPLFSAILAGTLVSRMRFVVSVCVYVVYQILSLTLLGKILERLDNPYYDGVTSHLIFLVVILYFLVLHGLGYLFTNYMLSKRLNLE